ncbi:MAG: GNAT family N-acetyltransferase [Candidatus Lloydbacteria bacterium]|nr:GNAT family N-acetyltransferase [Candidatus Lloydbacteria bacterium]
MLKLSQYAELEKDIPCINKLLRQLHPEAPKVTKEIMVKMLEKSNVKIAILRDKSKNNQIFGMASLHVIRTFFGLKGIVENVIVDEEYRGKGRGKELMNGLIEAAKKKGVVYLELTSGPERQNAQKMYESLGFKKRETNVYRLELK